LARRRVAQDASLFDAQEFSRARPHRQSESPEVINSQSDKTDGQTQLSTRGQGRQKRVKSTSRSTTKKTANRKLPKARKSRTRPHVPEGFEARPRDNRWQLFRLHGNFSVSRLKLSQTQKQTKRKIYG